METHTRQNVFKCIFVLRETVIKVDQIAGCAPNQSERATTTTTTTENAHFYLFASNLNILNRALIQLKL